jgi:hypothetical protein
MSHYIKPQISSNYFTCPICDVPATFSSRTELQFSETKQTETGPVKVLYSQSRCLTCSKNII